METPSAHPSSDDPAQPRDGARQLRDGAAQLRDGAVQSTTTSPPGRPRWVAFGVILGMMLVLDAAPLVASAAIPPIPEDTVGVYERVMLHGEFETGTVIGGFIAPQGWVKVDAGTGEDADEVSPQSFITPDGDVTVTVSAQALVETSDELLRSGAPVGAVFAPIVRLESAPLLTADLLEYDLEAGAGVSQRIAVCEVLTSTACLLFEAQMRTRIAGPDAAQMLPEVAAMVASAEVLPSVEEQS